MLAKNVVKSIASENVSRLNDFAQVSKLIWERVLNSLVIKYLFECYYEIMLCNVIM